MPFMKHHLLNARDMFLFLSNLIRFDNTLGGETAIFHCVFHFELNVMETVCAEVKMSYIYRLQRFFRRGEGRNCWFAKPGN